MIEKGKTFYSCRKVCLNLNSCLSAYRTQWKGGYFWCMKKYYEHQYSICPAADSGASWGWQGDTGKPDLCRKKFLENVNFKNCTNSVTIMEENNSKLLQT